MWSSLEKHSKIVKKSKVIPPIYAVYHTTRAKRESGVPPAKVSIHRRFSHSRKGKRRVFGGDTIT